MAERRRYKKRNRTLKAQRKSSNVGTNIAKAAVAVGATAAFLRHGGIAKTNKFLTKYKRAYTNGQKYTPNKGLLDMTYKDLKGFAKGFSKGFSEASTQVNANPLSMTGDVSKNLLKQHRTIKQGLKNTNTIGRKKLQGMVSNDFKNRIANIDPRELDLNTKKRYIEYIDKAVPHAAARSKLRMDKVARSMKFSKEELPIIDGIKKRLIDTFDGIQNRRQDIDLIKVAKAETEAVASKHGAIGKHRQRASMIDKLQDKITGSQNLTVQEILDNEHAVEDKSLISFLKEQRDQIKAEDGTEAVDEFLNSREFKGLGLKRDKSGELYSTEGWDWLKSSVKKTFEDSIAGKILRLRDSRLKKEAPSFFHFATGENNPVLAKMINSEANKDSHILDQDVYYLQGKYYTQDGNDFKHIKELDNYYLRSGRYGSFKNQFKTLAGQDRFKQSDSLLFQVLDIAQDKESFKGSPLEAITSMGSKDKDEFYIGNVFDRMLNPDAETIKDYKKIAENLEYAKKNNFAEVQNSPELVRASTDLYDMYDMLSRSIKAPDSEIMEVFKHNDNDLYSISKMRDKNEMVSALGELYKKRAEEQSDGQVFKSDMLNSLAKNIIYDEAGAERKLRTGYSFDNLEMNSSLMQLFGRGNKLREKKDIGDLIREGIGHELVEKESSNYGIDSLLKTSQELKEIGNLSEAEHENFNKMIAKNIMDRNLFIKDLMHDSDSSIDIGLWNRSYAIGEFREFMTTAQSDDDSIRSKTASFLKDTLETLQKESTSIADTATLESDGIGNFQQFSEYIAVKDNVSMFDLLREFKDENPDQSILSILKNLNDDQKARAKEKAKEFLGQFTAGRDNLEDVTSLGAIPYWLLHRLNEFGNYVNVGLSQESMGSLADISKGIMFKRILPTAIGFETLDFLNDSAEAVGGLSLTGAFMSGVANVDIAIRGVSDTLGITDLMKEQMDINPIMQYLSDGTEFRNAEELSDYYERGYSPVRKGAFWTFGSINELRGAAIQYWQPTFARRYSSDYFDESMYEGSMWKKWSHSWMPNPINPLAPLARVMDPYYLDEMHKDDRPYPITGQMWDESTPWGAVLNNTVGKIIKPQRNLHSFRFRNGVDIKANIKALNEAIIDKAKNFTSSNELIFNGLDADAIDRMPMFNSAQGELDELVDDFTERFIDSSHSKYMDNNLGVFTERNQMLRHGAQNSIGLKGHTGNSIASFGASKSLLDLYKIDIDDQNFKQIIDTFGNDDDAAIMTNEKGEIGLYTTTKYKSEGIKKIDFEDQLAIKEIEAGDNKTKRNFYKTLHTAYRNIKTLTQIEKLNENTKALAFEREGADFNDDFYSEVPEKISQYSPNKTSKMLSDPTQISDLLNASKGFDLVDESLVSARLITGIYGYMLGEATGLGEDNKPRIATSQDMTSTSRMFWDEGYGGLGGNLMEIARRFIPDYRRQTRVNPLLNEMEDWLPERFRYGDPYASVPKGEMRLPGRGYESLNDLHPDQFGTYGAFDRMKILADIAPYSPEYKHWAKIAKATITDESLIAEMEEIKERRNLQGKLHDFYDYKALGKDLETNNIVVSEVLKGGRFRSGNTVYKIAGITVKGNEDENVEEVLNRYLHAGMNVTIETDASEDAFKENGTVNAAVYIDGESLADKMKENDDAKVKKTDTSAVAVLGGKSAFQKTLAIGSEFIAHLDIPFLNDQFLRVRSPMEAYKAEEVYGTPYQTWSHPIDTFLKPAMERAMHDRQKLAGLGYIAGEILKNKKGLNRFQKSMLGGFYLLSDRKAFVGGAVSLLVIDPRTENKKLGMLGGARLTKFGLSAAKILTGGEGYMDMAETGAYVGDVLGKFFADSERTGKFKHIEDKFNHHIDKIAKSAINKLPEHQLTKAFKKDALKTLSKVTSKTKFRALTSLIGSASAVGYKLMFKRGEYVPDRFRKKNEMNEYFDRLTHLKYQALYERAAKLAKEKEGFDVKDYLEHREKEKLENQEIKKGFQDIKKSLNSKRGSGFKKAIIRKLNRKMKLIDQDEESVIKGGEYTKAAILYKKAADSTMTALNKNSSWAQIVTALPKNEREFFMEFIKTTDKSERNDILKRVSPSLRKALKLGWGMSIEKEQSDKEYFKHHYLPGHKWEGWRADKNIDDIKIKTIENEGMNLADFGMYESQLREENVANSYALPPRMRTRGVGGRLKRVLKSEGLRDVDISLEPTSGGISQITANIKTWMGFRTAERKFKKEMSRERTWY